MGCISFRPRKLVWDTVSLKLICAKYFLVWAFGSMCQCTYMKTPSVLSVSSLINLEHSYVL